MISLAGLRFDAERSRGRRYPEPSHPYRTGFLRDRDRIVHSRAFRRLENKTQVFTPGLSDHFRNRLTHTIEVSQVARAAALALELNQDLTEALALVHDIGHPPFAHAGEDELDRLMRRYGERFDHNLHALRIVEHFEHPYVRFPGLNLTFELREGIVKHSHDPKPGENPETDPYLPDLRPPLEAQLIDPADEIAYNTGDLDDGFAAGLFTVETACGAIAPFGEAWQAAEGQFPGASERLLFHEVLGTVADWLVAGLMEGTSQACAAAGVRDSDGVRRHPSRLAVFTAETQAANRSIKQFLHHSVYFSKVLVLERRRSAAQISELFDFLLARPDALPEEYREFTAGLPPHRAVCDYIAGMTDGFFHRAYELWIGSPPSRAEPG